MLPLLLACSLVQDTPPRQEDVDAAIQRGADWLVAVTKQGLPGDVAINAGMGLSYDPLVLYTLVHAGVDKEDAAYRILVDRVAQGKIARTYAAACTAMALRAHDPAAHREKIFECAQFLIDTQCVNGQWGYGEPYDIPKMAKGDESGSTKSRVRVTRSKNLTIPTQPSGDNSNSQYAALGLYSCWMAGFDIDRDVVKRGIEWWERSQLGDGSWNYCEKGVINEKSGGFGSMTAGGGSSIIMLRRIKGDSVYSSAKRAVAWLGGNFSVTENPGGPDDRKRFHFYYLYALERLGDLYPTEKMGKHAWYAEGATWLVKNQKGGMWRGPLVGMEIADTCFAILFLERATKVATGDERK